jgi:hypothetical protein
MTSVRTCFLTAAFLLTGWNGPDASAQSGIERLEPPKAAPPPGSVDSEADADEDLRRKRDQRREREKSLVPPEPPYELQRRKKLLKEALIPRTRALMFEVSGVAGTVSTRGDRERYSAEPTSHFNIFYRYDAKNRDGKIGPWYGLRLAPFAGSGFHKKSPGHYGLTYFGPMIGVGKIDPAQSQDGESLRTEQESEVKIPASSGWVVGTGLAAVSRTGKSNEEQPDPDSDFTPEGIAFDSPGLWLEARYISILYGALGYNVIFGIQTGTGKEFIYAGIGFAGWD